MFFLGTSVLEGNKTFQHKDAKTNVTIKTDSGCIIIPHILLAQYISEGFARNAARWQTELCLWKINYFDWIFKMHFNMEPLHITYDAWNAPEHSISHLASQEYILWTVESISPHMQLQFSAGRKRIIDLIHSHLLGAIPSFVKGSFPRLHIT